MKKISEKQAMVNSRNYWKKVSFYLLTSTMATLCILAVTWAVNARSFKKEKEMTTFWMDNANGEIEFCAQEHIKYMEMRDYAWKLEKALAKCKKGR